MRKSTMSWIGNSEENMDLSHIYLAVPLMENNFWENSNQDV